MANAPIALFIYNRPIHTQKMLEALQCCEGFAESPLYLFCDGAKENDDDAVQAARSVARQYVSDKAVFIESNVNLGLASSIINGVARLCSEYGKVIVLEDDLLAAPSFLTYMNDALELYAHEEAVMQISGHMFSVPQLAGKQEAFFLPFTTSWGWATWKRAWDSFDREAKGWEQLKTDDDMRSRFNLDDSYDYFSMIKKQMAGKIDSWAIRWYWSVFQHNGLVLYPPSSLVENIGFDGSGTHGWRSEKITKSKHIIVKAFTQQYRLPNTLEVDDSALLYVKRALKKAGGGFFSRAFQMIERLLPSSKM